MTKSHIQNAIKEAAEVIKKGGVCVIPTETGYGLSASIYNEDALRRIFEIKKRPFHKPLLILVNSIKDAPVDLSRISPMAKRLMERFWPGPLTLLLPAKGGISEFLTAGTEKVGVRISDNEIAQRLINEVKCPITATSANLSGMGLPKTIEEVKRQLVNPPPDYFLDGGKIKEGPPSTIVGIENDHIEIIREGAIRKEDILALC